MTPEAQRIAIAEACGLFRIAPLRRTTRKGKECPDGVLLWYCEEHHGGCGTYARLHDYLNDLNAMHEAEMWMFETYETMEGAGRLSLYTKLLRRLEHPLFATAAQRAEAFLRTLNLWDDSK